MADFTAFSLLLALNVIVWALVGAILYVGWQLYRESQRD